MKKILIAIFAVVVTAMWVLPAMAADTTFSGTYRVRLFSTNNNTDYASGDKQKTYTGSGSTTTEAATATDENSWIDQRFRLGVESKASDNVKGFVQLEIADNDNNRSDTWGSSGDSANGVSNQHVTARQAYLNFNAGPVNVNAGRQYFDGGLDNGLVVISIIDAFVLSTKAVEPLSLAFGYIKLAEGTTTSTTTNAQDRDNTAYLLQATMSPSDTLKGGVYFIYDSARNAMTGGTEENNPWWLGAGVDAKLDPINLSVHAAYKGGTQKKGCQPGSCGLAATDSAADLSYAAYAIDVDANMQFGPAKVGVAAGMGTGDDNATDKTNGAFTAVAGSYGNHLGGRPAIFFDNGEDSNGGATLTSNANSIDRSTLGNITYAEVYGSFKASDELTLNGLAAYFMQTATKRTLTSSTSTTWDSVLGTEVDVVAVYKLYKELALVAQAAWFMPGKGILESKSQAGNYSGIASTDTVSEYFAKVELNF